MSLRETTRIVNSSSRCRSSLNGNSFHHDNEGGASSGARFAGKRARLLLVGDASAVEGPQSRAYLKGLRRRTGEPGLAGRASELARAMEAVASMDRRSLSMMGQAARELAERRYDISHIGSGFVRLLEEACRRG
jgi:hypothetical protein